jgi:HlyD family secretion protein
MMIRKNPLFILIIAAVATGSIIYLFAKKDPEPKPVEEPLSSHPISPFKSSIFGVGIVEASTTNISLGAPNNRLVTSIDVKTGVKVNKGDVLIRLDDKDLLARLNQEEINYDKSLLELEKLETLPRSEDLEVAKATLAKAQISLEEAESEYNNVKGLEISKAIKSEDIDKRKYEFDKAKANFNEVKANFDKVALGARQEDIDIAKLNVLEMQALIDKTKADIAQTIIKSPIDGTILQIKIHEGEMPPLDTSREPIMIIGDIDVLHLRVNINQLDAPYFDPKATAVAYPQGDARLKFELEYIEKEPYLVTKKDLTGDVTETVDTRVLQVIYKFKNIDHNVYVEEQMDVFIEANFPKVDKNA